MDAPWQLSASRAPPRHDGTAYTSVPRHDGVSLLNDSLSATWAREGAPMTGRTWTHTAIWKIAGAHAVEFSKTAKPAPEGFSEEAVVDPPPEGSSRPAEEYSATSEARRPEGQVARSLQAARGQAARGLQAA
jgi:hypothetical protein